MVIFYGSPDTWWFFFFFSRLESAQSKRSWNIQEANWQSEIGAHMKEWLQNWTRIILGIVDKRNWHPSLNCLKKPIGPPAQIIVSSSFYSFSLILFSDLFQETVKILTSLPEGWAKHWWYHLRRRAPELKSSQAWRADLWVLQTERHGLV